MMRASLRVLSVAAVAGVLAVTVACGDSEGTTPNCSDIPLYDVRDASPDDIANRKAAEAEGCVTTPGTASTNDPTAPPPDAGTD